jgi:hypothetical protein
MRPNGQLTGTKRAGECDQTGGSMRPSGRMVLALHDKRDQVGGAGPSFVCARINPYVRPSRQTFGLRFIMSVGGKCDQAGECPFGGGSDCRVHPVNATKRAAPLISLRMKVRGGCQNATKRADIANRSKMRLNGRKTVSEDA